MPAHGADNEEERHAQRKAKGKQRKRDLQALQDQIREAQEAEQQAREENEVLRQQLNNQQAPNLNQAIHHGGDLPSKSEVKYWKKAAVVAGRRIAALYAPFLDGDSLADHRVQGNFEQILDRVQKSKDSDDEPDDAENPATYWDQPHFSLPAIVDLVEEVVFNLPKSPGHLWMTEWFQDAIKLGIRKQRGDIVHSVAKHYEKVFDIHDPAFENHSQRPELEGVQVLMATFLHINEEDDEGELDLSLFFREMCLVRVIRLLLNGPSAIRTGRRSTKSRKSHAKMWNLNQVTPSLLAFGATVIKFVLSGEPSFDEAGHIGGVNYTDYHHARLQLLEEVYENNPAVYYDLIQYYNHLVFPDQYQEQGGNNGAEARNGARNAGMDADDENFIQRLRHN